MLSGQHDTVMDDQDPPRASFLTLPPELQLRILAESDPQSLVRLSQTCRDCYHIARAQSLWRAIALDLVSRHRYVQPATAARPPAGHFAASPAAADWFNTAAFLLRNAHHLGYFASSQPFT